MTFSQICPNRNTTPNSFIKQYLGLSQEGASSETDRSEVLRHSWYGMIKISHCACSKTARAEQLYKFLNVASLPRHVLLDGKFLAIINLSFLIVFKICSRFCSNIYLYLYKFICFLTLYVFYCLAIKYERKCIKHSLYV